MRASQTSPVGAPSSATREAPAPLWCDLCDEPMSPDPDVFAVTDLNICPQCLEDTISAPALDARSEMGLVGSGGVRC